LNIHVLDNPVNWSGSMNNSPRPDLDGDDDDDGDGDGGDDVGDSHGYDGTGGIIHILASRVLLKALWIQRAFNPEGF